MGKKRNLNGLPGNLAMSYLSTLGYYNGGYMADWLNFIARYKNIDTIYVDVLSDKIEPAEADFKALKVDLGKLRQIIKSELTNNGFKSGYITRAVLKFEIPIEDSSGEKLVYCYPFIEDQEGRIYKPKNIIVEKAYEVGFKPNVFSRDLFRMIKGWLN